jgi:hypothetical protein
VVLAGLMAVGLTGCSNLPGSSSGNSSGTISTTPRCTELHTVLNEMAKLSFSQWNQPVSDLPDPPRAALLAAGVSPSEHASAAYASTVGSAEWGSC